MARHFLVSLSSEPCQQCVEGVHECVAKAALRVVAAAAERPEVVLWKGVLHVACKQAVLRSQELKRSFDSMPTLGPAASCRQSWLESGGKPSAADRAWKLWFDARGDRQRILIVQRSQAKLALIPILTLIPEHEHVSGSESVNAQMLDRHDGDGRLRAQVRCFSTDETNAQVRTVLSLPHRSSIDIPCRGGGDVFANCKQACQCQ